MTINLNLAKALALVMLLSACADNGHLKGIAINPEYTGGITNSQRPYTQTSDGKDHVLTMTKTDIAPVNSLSIENISIERGQVNYQISISLNQQQDPLKFVGALPSALNTVSNFVPVSYSNDKEKQSTDTLTLSCAEVNCPATVIGSLKTSLGSATFTLRSITAQARILYLSKHDAFEISNSFTPYYPAVPGFISQFQQSTAVSATSYEVAFGKAAAKITLNWGNSRFCIETDVTTTDTSRSPLTRVRVTCGQENLPKIKIDLAGNNQKGKLALRFNIQDRMTFVLFVDLNGKTISDPLFNVDPQTLISNNGFGKRLFPENLNYSRTFNIVKQLYSDIPNDGAVVLPEQKYGFEVLQKWLDKWQGKKVDPGTCWGEGTGKANIRHTLISFLKYAPPNFSKVQHLFEKQDVPSTFMFTTLVESPKYFSKSPEVQVSTSNAVGPWQLMDSVAKDWGLAFFPTIDGKADPRDERGNFEKATRAAISQYDRLLDYFGESDYKLALAAYNQGAGSLLDSFVNAVDIKEYDQFFQARSAKNKSLTKPENYQERIDKNKSDIGTKSPVNLSNLTKKWKEKIPNYWFLHEFHMMSCETRDYVPKLVSAMIVGEDPQAFGF